MIYPSGMKHLVDIDEEALSDARATLGTVTIKDTVNTALRMAAADAEREEQIAASMRVLATLQLSEVDRERAWR